MGRVEFDARAYEARTLGGCFVCRFLLGEPGFEHDVVLDDGEHVVFLNRYPTTLGQLLVAPRRHVERFESDLDAAAWTRLQLVVLRAAEALGAAVPSERIYTASLGSRARNRHVHVHVAAVPPGLRPEDQQLVLLDAERSGIVTSPEAERARIVEALRSSLAGS